jgi:hypothetical protein
MRFDDDDGWLVADTAACRLDMLRTLAVRIGKGAIFLTPKQQRHLVSALRDVADAIEKRSLG